MPETSTSSTPLPAVSAETCHVRKRWWPSHAPVSPMLDCHESTGSPIAEMPSLMLVRHGRHNSHLPAERRDAAAGWEEEEPPPPPSLVTSMTIRATGESSSVRRSPRCGGASA